MWTRSSFLGAFQPVGVGRPQHVFVLNSSLTSWLRNNNLYAEEYVLRVLGVRLYYLHTAPCFSVECLLPESHALRCCLVVLRNDQLAS